MDSSAPRHLSSPIQPRLPQSIPGRYGRTIIPPCTRFAQPLPADVVADQSGLISAYRRFPVFSAPWLLGRCTVCIPLTAALGAMESALVGLELRDTRLGWKTAAVSIPIWIIIGSAGPSLDPEAFWQIHRSVIVRAGAIQRIETGIDGRTKLTVKGRSEALPVSQAFQFRFRPM